jgi:predicted acylesterase/phospholipase RssA
VRALFQAHFLHAVSRKRTIGKFWKRFDFIIGTSGGSLVAAGLCKGLSPKTIARIIETRAPDMFARTKRLPPSGAASLSPPLENLLNKVFGAKTRLGDFKKPMLGITATDLAQSKVRVFTPIHDKRSRKVRDAPLLLVDVLMASCALPGVFKARQVPDAGNRYYVDGGLWANAPLLAAVALAAQDGRPAQQIKVLSIGSARVGYSSSVRRNDSLEPDSSAFHEHLFNLASSASEHTAREAVARFVGRKNVRFIDCSPKTPIGTWDTERAIQELPRLAIARAKKALTRRELEAVIN